MNSGGGGEKKKEFKPLRTHKKNMSASSVHQTNNVYAIKHSYALVHVAHILLNISAITLQTGKRINSYTSLINYADMTLNRFQVGQLS